jgi:hypothetical protein
MAHEGNASKKTHGEEVVGMKVPLVLEGLVLSMFCRYTDFP